MQRKRQPSAELVAMYLRLPRDIKERLERRAEQENISQAALVVEILAAELDILDDSERVRNWLANL